MSETGVEERHPKRESKKASTDQWSWSLTKGYWRQYCKKNKMVASSRKHEKESKKFVAKKKKEQRYM